MFLDARRGVSIYAQVYIMLYALIMLNTDLHNPNVRPKISEDDFVRSLRGTMIPEGPRRRGPFLGARRGPVRCSRSPRAGLLADGRARAYYKSIKAHPLGAERPPPAKAAAINENNRRQLEFIDTLPVVIIILAYVLNAYAYWLGYGRRY